jgi:hypothetical protein
VLGLASIGFLPAVFSAAGGKRTNVAQHPAREHHHANFRSLCAIHAQNAGNVGYA